ncbi:double-strand-break repair protein rad21 homolog [Oscarella lobularis]|uniref:double-strand-break repair protein rad21 homolog n=1 Tax=Oscarella lobularis TaxID=121494 RepID=UPI003313D167
MFYSHHWLGKKGKFATVWYVGTCGKSLKIQEKYIAFDVVKACSDILTYKGHFSLRTSAILLHGIVLLYEMKRKARSRAVRRDFFSKLVRPKAISLPRASTHREKTKQRCTLEIDWDALNADLEDQFDVSFILPNMGVDSFETGSSSQEGQESVNQSFQSEQSLSVLQASIQMIDGMDSDIECDSTTGDALDFDLWKNDAKRLSRKRSRDNKDDDVDSIDLENDDDVVLFNETRKEFEPSKDKETNNQDEAEAALIDQSTEVVDLELAVDHEDAPGQRRRRVARRRRRVPIDSTLKLSRRFLTQEVQDTSAIVDDCRPVPLSNRFATWPDGKDFLNRTYSERSGARFFVDHNDSDDADWAEGSTRQSGHFLEAPSSSAAPSGSSRSSPALILSENERQLEPIDLFGNSLVDVLDDHHMTTIAEEGPTGIENVSTENESLTTFGTKRLYALLTRLNELLKGSDVVTFFHLVPPGRISKTDAARAFMLLLKAANDGILSISQRESYGDIYLEKGFKWPIDDSLEVRSDNDGYDDGAVEGDDEVSENDSIVLDDF